MGYNYSMNFIEFPDNYKIGFIEQLKQHLFKAIKTLEQDVKYVHT